MKRITRRSFLQESFTVASALRLSGFGTSSALSRVISLVAHHENPHYHGNEELNSQSVKFRIDCAKQKSDTIGFWKALAYDFLVKLVDCLYAHRDNYNVNIIMMLYWGAWFNAASGPIFWGSEALVTAANIPKPILIAFEILARLGKSRLGVAGPLIGGRYGIIAIRVNETFQFLVYDYAETEDDFATVQPIDLDLANFPS